MADLHEVKAEELHTYWPFLKRGLEAIQHKLKPSWLPEDLYSMLRTAQANCLLAKRGDRLLGFGIFGRQPRLFSYEPELFLWAAYTRPMREWMPEDNMPEAVSQCWEYLTTLAKTHGISSISWVTSPSRGAAFKRKFDFRAKWITMTVDVNGSRNS